MKFRREPHRIVGRALEALDGEFLDGAECFFGGGTYQSLIMGEYRVSRDIDFLCSSRAGFRVLRETITERSLGAILRDPLPLAREVRADRDGIRTFFDVADARVKFEILFESRVDVVGKIHDRLAIPVLAPEYCVAEKLLANADRVSMTLPCPATSSILRSPRCTSASLRWPPVSSSRSNPTARPFAAI